MMDAGQEELLGLAVRISELRQKVADLPLVRRLAALEAEFERRSAAGRPANQPETPANKPPVKTRPSARPPSTFRARVEAVFRQAKGPVTWQYVGKSLGVDPKRLRSTMSTLLDKKRIDRVNRGR